PKAAAAADANDADALTIHEGLRAEKINSRAEVFNQRLERGRYMRLAATLAVVRGIVRDGHKAALCHRLRIQPRALFFHRAIRTANHDRGIFFRTVDIFG